jgi:hypothetical protein
VCVVLAPGERPIEKGTGLDCGLGEASRIDPNRELYTRDVTVFLLSTSATIALPAGSGTS